MKINIALILIAFGLVYLPGCRTDNGNEKLQEESQKVGKSATKVVKGIKAGIENATKINIDLSENIKNKGVSLGKVKLDSKNGGRHNMLNVYMIFEKNINKTVTVKVINNNGDEVGRTKQLLKGTAGEATYIDFIFPKQTNIDRDFKITME